MKLNKLSLQTKFNVLVLSTLLIAMSLMLYLSLYFYEKHFREEIYEDFRAISTIIISEKLYTMEDMTKIKEKLTEKKNWATSHFDEVLEESTITISKEKPKNSNDFITLSIKKENLPWITFSRSHEHVKNGYTELMNTLLMVLLIIFSFSTLIILWGIRSLTRPIFCITKLCKDIENQTPILPLCHSNSREVSELYQAITSLLNKNRHICEGKVDLFKEAAHELKAPLAIMQARLNLLQESKNYSLEKYEKETSQDIATMNSKLKELLFLKEIEADMQQDALQEICMMSQCKNMQESFKPLLELKNVTIETDWSDSFIVLAHSQVLRKVMQVIFENVFLHAPANSTIEVNVFADEKKMVIKNEIDTEGSSHNSSHIGLQIVSRLAKKLHYNFSAIEIDSYFITTIQFQE